MQSATKAIVVYLGLMTGVALAQGEDKGAAEAKPAAAAPEAAAAEKPAAEAKSAATDGFAGKETVCKNGKEVRKVKTSFGNATTGADCKALYIKETEAAGAEKVLWNSPREGKGCLEHAASFVEKLKGQGWTCD